ncbi:MAG: hypothetical protein EBU93_05835, partial [Chlamydiae bacterium]|nr:hypothetical protein [Chlamydiota bacterium]
DEEKYQAEIKGISDKYGSYEARETASELEAKKQLKEEKLLQIRKNLKNDQGFFDLFNKLGDLQKIYREMENRVWDLRHPSITTKMYSAVRGRNSKDMDMIDKLELKQTELRGIIHDIKTLEPIYTEPIRQIVYTERGGKRKTRRNQKTKKSKKNRRKSKRSG